VNLTESDQILRNRRAESGNRKPEREIFKGGSFFSFVRAPSVQASSQIWHSQFPPAQGQGFWRLGAAFLKLPVAAPAATQ
jgi:hypothetical protein